MIPESIKKAYGFDASFQIHPLGSGHIHKTYLVTGSSQQYVLQRINHFVFKQPDVITQNIKRADAFLKQHHPEYLFLSIVQSKDGKDLVYDPEGWPWRLFPFIERTLTVDAISSPEEAYEAARGFARLTRNLDGCNMNEFAPTIERFHDLGWRYEQFESALSTATSDRLKQAEHAIKISKEFSFLADEYKALTSTGKLKLRLTHNDTKINNILFDSQTRKAVCVIDLDTLMPGYFIYDLGDMIRTFVSPVSEEENDLSRIEVRREVYESLLRGYMIEMNDVLTEDEKSAVSFSGLMMTYIMALRFLTDFLNGDVYYITSYAGQNLNRSRNQLRLLELLRAFQKNEAQ